MGIAPHDDPELTLLSGTFNPDAEAALAWCLREAVTNVIRHSGAKNCFISLSRHDETQTLSLQVRDDGRGYPDGNPAGSLAGGPADSLPESPPGTGTGLHGMSERLCAIGGCLELRPGTQGFCLVATVPVAPVVSAAAGVTVTT